MIPFAPGFFKPIIAATADSYLSDSYDGTGGTLLSAHQTDQGNSWVYNPSSSNEASLDGSSGVKVPLVGYFFNVNGRYYTALEGGAFVPASGMTFELQRTFEVQWASWDAAVHNSTSLHVGKTTSTVYSADDSIGIYASNNSTDGVINIGYWVKQGAITKASYGTTAAAPASFDLKLTYDGTSLRFYINTVLSDTTALAYTSFPTSIQYAVVRIEGFGLTYVFNIEKACAWTASNP